MSSHLTLLTVGSFEQFSSAMQKEIYKEYYELAYGSIFYMVKDHASTEDLIQESFLKVVRHMPDIDQEGKLRAWIRTVVKNTVYNYLRKNRKRRNEVDVDDVIMYSDLDIASSSETVEKEIELKIMAEKIESCLLELKPEYRALIELRWKRDFSYKEIADLLGVTEETVKHKLYRARESVRKRFAKVWGDSEDARRIR